MRSTAFSRPGPSASPTPLSGLSLASTCPCTLLVVSFRSRSKDMSRSG